MGILEDVNQKLGEDQAIGLVKERQWDSSRG